MVVRFKIQKKFETNFCCYDYEALKMVRFGLQSSVAPNKFCFKRFQNKNTPCGSNFGLLNWYVRPLHNSEEISPIQNHVRVEIEWSVKSTDVATIERKQRCFNIHVKYRKNIHGFASVSPCFPDFSTCDFFLWSYLKFRVYVDKPRILEELKDTIQLRTILKRQNWLYIYLKF